MDQFANLIAIVFVLHFCWSYYWNCYRKGYTLDLWHYSLLVSLFVIHIMLPFSRSDLNIFALGPTLLRRMQAHVTQAYLISAFGYLAFLIGGNIWRVHLGLGFRSLFSRIAEIPARGALLLIRSRRLLIIHGLVAIALQIGVLLYYFKVDGFGFNLRGLLLVMPALRPIAQFTAFYSVLIGSYCLARFYIYRERSMLLILCLIITGLLFFGERNNLASVALLTVLVLFIQKGRRIKLFWLASGALAALFLAASLDALRRHNFSVVAIAAGFVASIFYGNSFSDTRDFALILSFWDGHYLLGKTYLAGLLAFIPRFLSTFRDTWALGVVTATIVGFKATEHPGIRIGLFGEAFLNFGLVGVFLLGLFAGATIRLVDLRMKQSVTLFPKSDLRVYTYLTITLLAAVAENSSIASTLYTILLIFFVSWVMLKVFDLSDPTDPASSPV